MKKILIFILAFIPFMLFAAGGVESATEAIASSAEAKENNYDIVQRTVNFIIFAGILWYLLAEKIKTFFVSRTLGIQAELDKVQDTLNESKLKVDEAVLKLDEAKKLAIEIVSGANSEIDTIKTRIAQATDSEIAHLNKNFEEKIKLESRKAKKIVVQEILEELLSEDLVAVSQDELASIVLKKVV